MIDDSTVPRSSRTVLLSYNTRVYHTVALLALLVSVCATYGSASATVIFKTHKVVLQ